jgi:hypothetical protein
VAIVNTFAAVLKTLNVSDNPEPKVEPMPDNALPTLPRNEPEVVAVEPAVPKLAIAVLKPDVDNKLPPVEVAVDAVVAAVEP